MSTKTILFSAFIGIVVVGAGYFLLRTLSSNHTQIATNISSSTPISQSGWKTYENTAFKYRIQYPSSMSVGPLDRYDYITQITQKGEIATGLVNIIAWRETALTGFSAEENKQFISLDLKSFAEAIRTYQVKAQNPNIKNKRVGDLQEMTLVSSTAYSFTLSESFTNSEGGYLIPSGVTNRYIFLESPDKRKFMIWYPKDDPISQKIVDSFEFTNSSTTAPTEN